MRAGVFLAPCDGPCAAARNNQRLSTERFLPGGLAHRQPHLMPLREAAWPCPDANTDAGLMRLQGTQKKPGAKAGPVE